MGCSCSSRKFHQTRQNQDQYRGSVESSAEPMLIIGKTPILQKLQMAQFQNIKYRKRDSTAIDIIKQGEITPNFVISQS